MVSGHCHLPAVLEPTGEGLGGSRLKGRGCFALARDPQSPEPQSGARQCPSDPRVRGHPQSSPRPVSPSPAAAVPGHLGAPRGWVRGAGTWLGERGSVAGGLVATPGAGGRL